MHTFQKLTIQTKRNGCPFPSYCTGKCCTELNILTIEQSYYSTHQLYLFLSRHISVLIRILYRRWNVYILAQHNSWIHPVLKTGGVSTVIIHIYIHYNVTMATVHMYRLYSSKFSSGAGYN